MDFKELVISRFYRQYVINRHALSCSIRVGHNLFWRFSSAKNYLLVTNKCVTLFVSHSLFQGPPWRISVRNKNGRKYKFLRMKTYSLFSNNFILFDDYLNKSQLCMKAQKIDCFARNVQIQGRFKIIINHSWSCIRFILATLVKIQKYAV